MKEPSTQNPSISQFPTSAAMGTVCVQKWTLLNDHFWEIAHRPVSVGKFPKGKQKLGMCVWIGYWTGNLEAWIFYPSPPATQLYDLRSSISSSPGLDTPICRMGVGSDVQRSFLLTHLSFWHTVCWLPRRSLKALGAQILNQKRESSWKLLKDYELSTCLETVRFQ